MAAEDGIDPHEDIVVAADELAGLPVDLPPPPKLPGRDFDVKGALGDLRTRHARKKELRQWNADRVLELVRVTGMDHALVNAELNKRSGVERVSEADEVTLRRHPAIQSPAKHRPRQLASPIAVLSPSTAPSTGNSSLAL